MHFLLGYGTLTQAISSIFAVQGTLAQRLLLYAVPLALGARFGVPFLLYTFRRKTTGSGHDRSRAHGDKGAKFLATMSRLCRAAVAKGQFQALLDLLSK